jgi:hypothetical protein
MDDILINLEMAKFIHQLLSVLHLKSLKCAFKNSPCCKKYCLYITIKPNGSEEHADSEEVGPDWQRHNQLLFEI